MVRTGPGLVDGHQHRQGGRQRGRSEGGREGEREGELVWKPFNQISSSFPPSLPSLPYILRGHTKAQQRVFDEQDILGLVVGRSVFVTQAIEEGQTQLAPRLDLEGGREGGREGGGEERRGA